MYPYRETLVSVSVWFLFYWYILIVLRVLQGSRNIFILNKMPHPSKKLGPILHPQLP